ncbi:MAG: hypothetical protein KDC80_27595 [Saprospiraceae bacterium]|nr:hypothetical protein [Saprospiraceae bacterium]
MRLFLGCSFVFICSYLTSGQKVTNTNHFHSEISFTSSPREWSFSNLLEVDTSGGHLQGIQQYRHGKKDYYFVSGSSANYSYLGLIAKEVNEVLRIEKLFDAPLRHAGGFQICQNYLAIGVEDNVERNRSKVCIYDISGVPDFSTIPVYTIERSGTFERATAGCVALARLNNKWLLVVGDWNTRHLDFYISVDLEIANGFTLEKTIVVNDIGRKDWSDEQWLPYQNINLFISDSTLFLCGLGISQGKNTMDLFQIGSWHEHIFHLRKLARYQMKNTGGSFSWAAGVVFEETFPWEIFSTERNLQGITRIYSYSRE